MEQVNNYPPAPAPAAPPSETAPPAELPAEYPPPGPPAPAPAPAPASTLDSVGLNVHEHDRTSAPAPAPAPTLDSVGLNLHDHDRTLRTWRLGVRIVCAVFVALAMILFIARGATLTNRRLEECRRAGRYGYRCYTYSYAYYDLISLPMLGAAMIWNIAEFITFCVNKRGSHPGVHIGLDIVMFCCLLAGGILGIFRWGMFSPYDYDDGLGTAGAAMELIACVLHCALFIMACVATHRRRMLFKKHILELHSHLHAAPKAHAFPPAPAGMSYYMLPAHTQPQYYELGSQQHHQQHQQQQQPYQPYQYQPMQENGNAGHPRMSMPVSPAPGSMSTSMSPQRQAPGSGPLTDERYSYAPNNGNV